EADVGGEVAADDGQAWQERHAPTQRDAGADAEGDAEQAAEGAEDAGLDEELPDDVAAGGAQRAPDADLAGPLGDGREHDVHDADAADEQGDAGDGGDDGAVGHGGAPGVLEQFIGHDQAQVGEVGVADLEDAPDLVGLDQNAFAAGDGDVE